MSGLPICDALPLAALTLTAAALLDAVLGDPVYRAHPVRLLGHLVRVWEGALRRRHYSGRVGGVLLVLLVLASAVASYAALRAGLHLLHPWAAGLFDLYIVYSCIALKDMIQHARPIAQALAQHDLPLARARVQMIVGRQSAQLDGPAIARATVESVGESFVDGFLAPVGWYAAAALLAGLVGLPTVPVATATALAYRAVNTMDSMVGYRNATYLRFGWAAARLDDLLNLLPARLSIPLLTLGAALCGLDARGGWRIGWRDRLKHASPNSAHAESVVAGALGVRLGGPTTYPHGTVAKPWLGDGTPTLQPAHIERACRLVATTGTLAIILAGGATWLCH